MAGGRGFALGLLALLLAASALPVQVCAQQATQPKHYIPEELRASDPEIRQLLDAARDSADNGEYDDAAAKAAKALALARAKGFVGDRALAETAVGEATAAKGKLTEALVFYRAALQDAVDSSNPVLESQLLGIFAAYSQVGGRLDESLSLLAKGVDAARRSQNVYAISSALGAQARVQIATGKAADARKSLEEALRIDSLNHYDDLKALHQVYLAYVIGMESPKEPDKPLPQLEEAVETAISSDSYYALSLGLTALGASYVYEGKTDQGLPILDGLLGGKLVYRGKALRNPKAFQATLQLPFIRAQVLETLGIAYGAAGKPDQALAVWTQLFDFAKSANSPLLQTEAAHAMADIYRNRGDVDQALRYYGLAAEGWRGLPNEARLTDALLSTGDLLLKNGRGQEAVRVGQELLGLTEKQGNYSLEILVATELGKEYARENDTRRAIESFERADRLLVTHPEVKPDDQSLLALYAGLSLQYEKAHDSLQEVIALEKGLAVAERMKDAKAVPIVAQALREKLEEMKAWERAETFYQKKDCRQALVYSEVLNLEGLTKAWKGDAEETKNLARLSQCPLQIVQESGGPEFLEENLAGMGPLLGGERRFVLAVLVNYFSTKENDQQKAFELAGKALPLIPAGTGGPPFYFDVDLRCSYVLSALLTNHAKEAAEQVGACLAAATDLNNPVLLSLAKRLAASIAEAQSAQSVAQEYLGYLATSNPDDPQPHAEMAWNYFQLGKEAEALAEWQIAVSLAERAGDKAKLAQLHYRIALFLGTRASPANDKLAVEHLRAALALAHELGYTEGEVTVLIALASHFSASQPSDARQLAEQALAIAEQSGRDGLIADAAVTLGDLCGAAGEDTKALELRSRAAGLYKKAGNKSRQATATLGTAWSLYSLHRPEEALKQALEAKRLADETGDWIPRYWARRGLGAFYVSQGDFEKSLAELHEALAISRASGSIAEQSTAGVLLSLSSTLQLVGEDQEALDDAREALQIAQRIGDKPSQLQAYDYLASIYGDRSSTVKDFQKALEAYQAGQALAGPAAPGEYRPSAANVIEVYFQTGQYGKVVELARQTIESCQKNKDAQCEAHGWMSLAEGLREQGKFTEAEAALKKAEPLAARAGDFYTTGRLYYGQAGLAFKEAHYQQAVDLYLKVVSMLQQVQGGSQEQQKSVQESYAFIYDDLIVALFALREQQPHAQGMDIPATALESAEASKANGFLASWGRVFVREMRRTLPAETQERERALASKQQELAAQLAAAKGGEADKLQKDYAAATEQLNAFVASLRKSNPGYAAVRFPEPVTLAVVPVRAGETVVEFKVTDQATYVWMIHGATGAPEVVAFYKVPQSREWLRERILKMRAAYNGGSPEGVDPSVPAELFAALFPAPYSQPLKSAAAITFIPDDILFLIPFEMLSPDAARGEYPLANVPTSYYPSLAALRLSRAATHSGDWQASFLGVGDPVSSAEDDRYALARVFNPDAGSRGVAVADSPEETKQAEEPATTQGFSFAQDRVETRLGAQATKQLVLETDLNRFRYLHFATHGFLPVAGGKVEPGLVLSYDGRDPKQMMLTLSEILQLHLKADMVVLSACNTGSGSATRADGVANLGRAFMAAGASSATVSLWSVADNSTALLMEEYYRNLAAGKSKAESLARARAFLRSKGYRSPYYWAAFVLMGD
jgi:CHAT domain-containing protein